MSHLARSAMSARLAKLPHLPPLGPEDEGDEEGDSLGSLSFQPPAPRHRAARKHEPNPAYAPVSAAGFFAQAVQVAVPSAGLDVRAYYTPPKSNKGTVVVCHHGAGYSALSFALLAKELVALSGGECGVLAYDARAHGKTQETTTDAKDLDLSLARLSADLLALIQVLYPAPAEAPSFLLVGHSMGGAVVVDATPAILDAGYRVVGVSVIDVVEGSALEALPHMHALLAERPTSFGSVEEAVEWHLNTHALRNADSARVSIPAILHQDGALWTWRAPLQRTAPFWESWFTGLSRKFLATRAARLLILAGTDRLDRELMIGQLQGKFQLVIVPEVGHLVQEDDPARAADILVEFWRRNDRVVPGVKKVGEL